MAQPQQQPPPEEEEQLTSYFPDPPPFYKHFTEDNLQRLADFKKSHDIPAHRDADDNTNDAVTSLTASQLLELPPELRYLIPPEPPTQDTEYSVFGKKTKVNEADNFEEIVGWIRARLWDEEAQAGHLDWKYTQLFPSSSATEGWSSLDRQNYLFRFLRSIILSYIELLGIMAQNPKSDAKEEKLKDIMTLVLNMHALVNEYRPHQARETLIRVMEEQVERKRSEIEGVRRMGARVREALEGFEREALAKAEDAGEADGAGEVGEQQKRTERQRDMWGALDEVLGP